MAPARTFTTPSHAGAAASAPHSFSSSARSRSARLRCWSMCTRIRSRQKPRRDRAEPPPGQEGEAMNVHETVRPDAVPASDKPVGSGGFWDFKSVNAARSMLVFGLGSAIGLGIAGYGLFTAKGTVTHVVPPENVALINQRPILRTDFIAQTESETTKAFGETTLEERLKVPDEMVREELFVQRGLELDFPGTDPDTRAALVAAVEQQVVADVTTHQPGDDELRKYFEEHRSNYSTEGTMILHNLVLPKAKGPEAMAIAKKAADALRAHEPLEAVLKTHGLMEIVPEHAG